MDSKVDADDFLWIINHLKSDSYEDKIIHLDKLIAALQISDEGQAKLPTELNSSLLDDLLEMLNNFDQPAATKVCNIIAELAKQEHHREKFVRHKYIESLVKRLSDHDLKMVIQVCRALGNICYENDSGREAVDACGGLPTLLNLLERKTLVVDEDATKIRLVGSGFLLNLTNSHDILQQKAVEHGALDVLTSYLSSHCHDIELVHIVLSTISILIDSESSLKEPLTVRLSTALLNFLDTENGGQHEHNILDILNVLAENDAVKEMVAFSNLPRRLVDMANEHNCDNENNDESDDDDDGLRRMAADLIVIVLRGDKSMEALFDKGNGIIVTETLKWLISEEEHLQVAAALAVGNFARNDEHCLQLVSLKVVPKLLALIEGPHKSNIALQHACLSALRNLAIPAANKSVLVASGTLQAVLKLSTVEVTPVIFKLLGVIRMLIDGQREAAEYVISDDGFMTQLAEWCTIKEHVGVKGESCRLVAWLVKNSRTAATCDTIIRVDVIGHLVEMVMSEHIVMQTEALLALSLICCVALDSALSQLKAADVLKSVRWILSKEDRPPEVLCNALTLTLELTKQESMKDEMIEIGLDDVINSLKSHEDGKVRQLSSHVYECLVKDAN